MKAVFIVLAVISSFSGSFAIWCYQCTTATPGCTEPFNWRGVGYLGNPCPDSEDVCVKLIERKGANLGCEIKKMDWCAKEYRELFFTAREVITRDCLSNFKAFRTDIPADTYEGCRPAAKDVNLANFVNNTVKELDIKRDWYDQTIWCFCFLDHRCNSATIASNSMALLALSIAVLLKKALF